MNDAICQSCGGIVGRDCFNTNECAHITRDMASRYQSMPDVEGMRQEITTLQSQREELVKHTARLVAALELHHKWRLKQQPDYEDSYGYTTTINALNNGKWGEDLDRANSDKSVLTKSTEKK